uniref:Saccharopine dehydrogenase-like C-terminal domain-containing protein n=1 Tax=Romanomermis culicivorax TaxID=13658 RepID=A0A915I465_ROMCU
MELIDSVKEQGGKVTSFVSWCGGLPAPEFSDNPLRYKFSWSPRNVLLNALSPAKYIYQGRVVDVAPGHLLDEPMLVDFLPGFNLEAYPNRDSTTYARLYKLNEAKTVLRATLRYRGFGQAMRSFLALGLIDPQQHAAFDPDFGPNLTWKQIMALLMNMKSDIFVDTLKSRIAERFGDEHSIEYRTLEDLNMLDDEEFVERKGSPLDTLSHYLTSKLSYKKNERDLCLLRHDVTVAWPNGSEEIHHVNLVKYGDANSYSAMASTVGYCTAIMAKMILDGAFIEKREIQVKGHVLPMNKAVYRPVLDRLAKEGIVAKSSKTIIKDDRFVKGMGNQSL